MPRVLIVDDHPFVRRGVQNLLRAFADWELCGEAGNAGDGIRMIHALKPDVVLMDVSMPGMDGIQATREVRRGDSQTKIVLITLHESVEVLRSGFRAGANGYLLKADAEEELIKALRVVMGNGRYISPKFDAKILEQDLRNT